MNFMNRLRRNNRISIPNLMTYITATMLAVYLLDYVTRVNFISSLIFSRSHILAGQIWRLVTFIFIPPSGNALFVVIGLYFYYFIGSTLENAWGSSQFTLYYLCGVIGNILAGFISGYAINSYLNLSLFFAFASLFPNQQVLLFFFIPIKVKYLAYFNWALFAIEFIGGNFVTRTAIIFSLLNYFLFFGPDILDTIRGNIRQSKRQKEFKKQMDQNRDMWR